MKYFRTALHLLLKVAMKYQCSDLFPPTAKVCPVVAPLIRLMVSEIHAQMAIVHPAMVLFPDPEDIH